MTSEKTRGKVVEAFLELAKDVDWADISLGAISKTAGVKLSVLRWSYDSKLAILEDHLRRVDAQVLENIDKDLADEPARERLFDVLMGRFDILAPHKLALRRLRWAAKRDPLLAATFAKLVFVSQTWMLNAAGISSSGLEGLVKAQGLAVAYARVFHTWLEDDDPGLAKTMAKLDSTLRSGERALQRLDCAGRLVGSLPGRQREKGRTPQKDAVDPEVA